MCQARCGHSASRACESAGRLTASSFELRETSVPIIIVEVMPKAELLDPQGKAVGRALARTGASRFTDVRMGKRFELSYDGDADGGALAEAQHLADSLLSNSVIEDVISVHFAGSDAPARPTSVFVPEDSLAAVPDGHA